MTSAESECTRAKRHDRLIVLVLGMHRGGTSSVAGTLVRLGFAAPKTLMMPAADNPKGFYESAKIMDLNNAVLSSAQSVWSDWRGVDEAWFASEEAMAFRQEAREILNTEFEGQSLVVVKDPRISRLMPFWRRVCEESSSDLRVIIPVRSPLEVAYSLKARNGFSTAEGVLIWLRHMLDAEVASRDLKRTVIEWDQFLADWRTVMVKAGEELDLEWPAFSPANHAAVDEFISNDLRSHSAKLAPASKNPDVPEWVSLAFPAFLTLANDPYDGTAINILNGIRHQFDTASLAFGRYFTAFTAEFDAATNEVESLRQEGEKARALIQKLDASLVAAETTKQQLSEKAVAFQSRIEEIEAALTAMQVENARLRDEVVLGNRSVAEMEVAARTAQIESAQLRDEVGARDQRLSELEAALKVGHLEFEQLIAELEARRRRVAELEVVVAMRHDDNRLLNEHAAANRQRIGALEATIEMEKAQSGELRDLFALRNQRIGELDGRLALKSAETIQLRGEISLLVERVSKLDGMLVFTNGTKTSLEKRLRAVVEHMEMLERNWIVRVLVRPFYRPDSRSLLDMHEEVKNSASPTQ